MTSYGDQSSGIAALRADGIDLAKLSTVAKSGTTTWQATQHRKFWVSGLAGIDNRRREIMEVSFGTERVVNHLSFKVSRFPLTLRVEYLDRNGDWQLVTYAGQNRDKGTSDRQLGKDPRPAFRRKPATVLISESVPSRVNSAQRRGHPQHFGKGHWFVEGWKINPVRTRKIRFVLQRNPNGVAPKGPGGRKVSYSLAIKDLSIGYRVIERADIPREAPDEPWWATGKDIVGSQTVYSTYEQPADRAVDGSMLTYWRSEPQPFPFAVVNFFLDLRSPDGVPPVIDRFWVDPITTGVNCNVYYSNSVPEGDFEGASDPIPPQTTTALGNPIPVRDAATQQATGINLGPVDQTGIEVSNHYAQLRYDQPWWVGIDADSLDDPAISDDHPLISLGTTQIVQAGNTLKVLAQSGDEAVIDLDPLLHTTNARYRLVVAYYPADLITNRPPYFRITYQLTGGYEPVTSEATTAALADSASPIRIGLHPDPGSTDVPAVTIRGLVVKSEALTPEVEQWFLDEGELFVADPDNAYEDRGTAQNARLRMHPMFLSPNNLFGVVGGPGDRYGDMVWTPISRDYVLRQGYLNLPPTKAAYWKFEMTGLIPQVYENFLTIDRDVLVFPPDVVANYDTVVGARNNRDAPAGVTTTANTGDNVAYSDVLNAIRTTPEPSADATKVLVVKDATQARRVAETGWVWHYQPWHIGSAAPQFMGTSQHRYESLRVKHSTKVAFFAGIREIAPVRVDYTFDDDTPEYVEHLLDTTFIDLSQTSGVEFGEGGLTSTSSHAEVTSKAFLSYRNVRGVQFASQETDSVQVLPDPDFRAEHMDLWSAYGDADLLRLGPNNVQIARGWFLYTYGDLEQRFLSYGAMDGTPYALLEGVNQPSGSAEGGITSQVYTPSGAGKILAVAEVTAVGNMQGPITLEIVATYDERVVASETRWVREGEAATLRVGYSPGALTEFRTYGDVETMVSTPTTYGELEAFRYFELESDRENPSDLYVRVRQQGQTDDNFNVHRIGLYDSPVAWFFSNDDGSTWWQAIDVRSNPDGVLIFPQSLTPEVPGTGRTLRWKARIYRADAVINALNVRPWYGSRARTAPAAYGLESVGPNKSGWDTFPSLERHPMWTERFNPIEHVYEEPIPVEPFWRNLAINPSGENEDTPDSWEAIGGTYEIVTPTEGGA